MLLMLNKKVTCYTFEGVEWEIKCPMWNGEHSCSCSKLLVLNNKVPLSTLEKRVE